MVIGNLLAARTAVAIHFWIQSEMMATSPMSWLQFIDSMTGHLALPIVVAVLLFLLRKQLTGLQYLYSGRYLTVQYPVPTGRASRRLRPFDILDARHEGDLVATGFRWKAVKKASRGGDDDGPRFAISARWTRRSKLMAFFRGF